MSFDKARNLVKFLLAGAIILCTAGLFIAKGGTMLSAMLTFCSFGCFLLAGVVMLSFCKCRHCGKRITLGLFKARVCPSCRRDLITGEKTRSSKRK